MSKQYKIDGPLDWGGDRIERKYWPEIGPHFANYEEFWATFICPATCRPKGIEPHRDIKEPMERVCMAHYSVYFHLGRAYDFRGAAEHMEDFFAHLSSVGDMVDQFLFSLWPLWAALEGEEKAQLPWKRQGILPLKTTDGEKFIVLSNEDVKRYEEGIRQFEESGKPIEHRFLSVRMVADDLIAAIHKEFTSARSLYKKLRDYMKFHVTPYRDLMTHATILGRIATAYKGQHWLPKLKYLRDYRRWTTVYECSSDDFESKFEVFEEIAQDQFDSVLVHLNALWEAIIAWLQVKCAANPEGFAQLCGSDKNWPRKAEEGRSYQIWVSDSATHTVAASSVVNRNQPVEVRKVDNLDNLSGSAIPRVGPRRSDPTELG